jgi:pimeloyl-ACP methyl ester carboxylesterase
MAGVDLAYDVDGAGRLLVLVHGITESRHSWDPVPLSDHYRVVRVDLRGHGQSPGQQPYDLPTLAGDVHAVVERESTGEAPIVVGHSMGGAVVTAYASLFPVGAAVNVDQPLALVQMQAQLQQAAPMLRGDGLADFIGALFAQMYGALDPAEVARLSALRRADQEVVLGMWSPLLDLSADDLGTLVQQIAALPPGTRYLSLHGMDPAPTTPAGSPRSSRAPPSRSGPTPPPTTPTWLTRSASSAASRTSRPEPPRPASRGRAGA